MKQIVIPIFLFIILSTLAFHTKAQEPNKSSTKKEIIQGNEYYKKQDWNNAKKHYTNALVQDINNPIALYNMANTLYKTKDNETSRKAYEQSIINTNDKLVKAKAYHNIGNTYANEEKWKEAATAYKNALKNNPNDADSKYNLSYVNQKIKKEEQEEQKKQEDKKQDKQQEKDNKQQENQEQQQKEEEKQNQSQQDQQAPKEDSQKDQQTQQSPSKISQQQAENILNALRQEEKRIQERKNEKKMQQTRRQTQDKDW
jgi:Ca-activated chloride channel family protein